VGDGEGLASPPLPPQPLKRVHTRKTKERSATFPAAAGNGF